MLKIIFMIITLYHFDLFYNYDLNFLIFESESFELS